MRTARLRRQPAHLEITAFINLIVVLVPFLLSTAVFTRLAVIELALPAPSSGVLERLKPGELKLEVVIRADALEVGDRIGGLIERLPAGPRGHDLAGLAALMHGLKARFPEQSEATVLAEPNTPYDTLVQVMDAMRAGKGARGAEVVPVALFPGLAVGDAPLRTGAGARP